MQCILTKWLPGTYTKPIRIKAFCSSGFSVTIDAYSTEYASHTEEAHRIAAEKLRDKMKWKGELIAGQTKDGYCFVFNEKIRNVISELINNPARGRVGSNDAGIITDEQLNSFIK